MARSPRSSDNANTFGVEHPAVLQRKLQALDALIGHWESAIQRFSAQSHADSISEPSADRGELLRQIKERLRQMYAMSELAPSLVQSDVAIRMESSGIATVVGQDIVQAVRQLEQRVLEDDLPTADKLSAYGDEFVHLVTTALDTALTPARDVRDKLIISLRPYAGKQKTVRRVAQECRDDAIKKLAKRYPGQGPAELLKLSKLDSILSKPLPPLKKLTKEIIRKVIGTRTTSKKKIELNRHQNDS